MVIINEGVQKIRARGEGEPRSSIKQAQVSFNLLSE
jgi:hypothetical protein